MTKLSAKDSRRKREKIQKVFWIEVGAIEHISLPELEDAIRKEFSSRDDRLVQEQVQLMQTEARIKLQSKIKVWIKQPST